MHSRQGGEIAGLDEDQMDTGENARRNRQSSGKGSFGCLVEAGRGTG
jgi:hypothetical protein